MSLVEKISQITGYQIEWLRSFAETAKFRYKEFEIDKRNGRGKRTIYHPSRELKVLQRLLNELVLNSFPISDKAMAYRKGLGIKENAQSHVKNRYLLKIDFVDFFPSFSIKQIKYFFKNKVDTLLAQDLDFICKICCRHGQLTIGAPTSPVLTNIILFEFDNFVDRKMKKNGIVYTRYADDLVFSTNKPDLLENCQIEVENIVKELKLPLKVNISKTVFTSKKRLRAITGVTLTSEDRLSVGRQRKRAIKSKVNKFKFGMLIAEEIKKLRGEIAYVYSIEPKFIDSLKKKYGVEIIERIRS